MKLYSFLLEGFNHKLKQFEHRYKKIMSMDKKDAKRKELLDKYNEDLKNFRKKRIDKTAQHAANYRMDKILDYNEKIRHDPKFSKQHESEPIPLAYDIPGQDKLDAGGQLSRSARKLAEKRVGLRQDKHWLNLKQHLRKLDKLEYGDIGYDQEGGKARRKKLADTLVKALKEDDKNRKLGDGHYWDLLFNKNKNKSLNDTAWKVNYAKNAINGTGDTLINMVSVPLLGLPIGKLAGFGTNFSHIIKSQRPSIFRDKQTFANVKAFIEKRNEELSSELKKAEAKNDKKEIKRITDDILSNNRFIDLQRVGHWQNLDLTNAGHSVTNTSTLLDLMDRDPTKRTITSRVNTASPQHIQTQANRKFDSSIKELETKLSRTTGSAHRAKLQRKIDKLRKQKQQFIDDNNRSFKGRLHAFSSLRAGSDIPAHEQSDNLLAKVTLHGPDVIQKSIDGGIDIGKGTIKGVKNAGHAIASTQVGQAVGSAVDKTKPVVGKFRKKIKPVVDYIGNIVGVPVIAKGVKTVGDVGYNVVKGLANIGYNGAINGTGGGVAQYVKPSTWGKILTSPKTLIHVANAGLPYLMASSDVADKIERGELPPEAARNLSNMWAQQASDDINAPWGLAANIAGRFTAGKGDLTDRMTAAARDIGAKGIGDVDNPITHMLTGDSDDNNIINPQRAVNANIPIHI